MAYHMRRDDRELKARRDIEDILIKGKFIVLALCQDNEPYIVTLSYGYNKSQNCLYLHCANEGMKLEFLKKNPVVCGTVIIDKGYIDSECGHQYETAVLRGNIQFLNSNEEKRLGIETILNHLETNPQPIYLESFKINKVYETITVLKLNILAITAKKGK